MKTTQVVINRCMDFKIWSIYTREYYLALKSKKKNPVLPYGTLVRAEFIMLNRIVTEIQMLNDPFYKKSKIVKFIKAKYEVSF